MDIKRFKARFDPILKRSLQHRITENRKLTTDKHIREITAYAGHLVMAGGKRIRPYMAFTAYETAGGKKDRLVMETLVGLELFHAFALVHDDIMDRGTMRHGLPTAHTRFGDSQAILLGDVLFNWANGCLSGTKGYPVFEKMIDEVITGQMLDVDSMTRKRVRDEMIEERHRLKTASYTFVRPMQVGIALAGTNPRLTKFSESYGMPLGIAFQIQDDLLDLVAKPDEIGKTAFSDLRDGQHTLFTQFIVDRGTRAEKAELKKIFGKKVTERDRARILRLFTESGAIEHGRVLIEGYFDEAERAVKKTFGRSKNGKPFYELVEYIRQRGH